MTVRGLDRAPAHVVEIRERGAECDRARDMRCSSLETVGALFPLRHFVCDSGDHFAAKLVGFHIGQDISVTIENADTGRSTAFVPGKSEEITADFLNVDGSMTGALSRINEGDDPVSACYCTNLAHGVDAGQRV